MSAGPAAAAPIVLGVGNALRGDDAAGLEVVRALQARLGPGAPARAVRCDLVELCEAWAGAARVIVVDAMDAELPPGAIRRFDAGRQPLPAVFATLSTHGLGLGAAVETARALGSLPGELTVYGIQVAQAAPGGHLSPEVEQAVEELAAELATALA